jgi:hypothetical protein
MSILYMVFEWDSIKAPSFETMFSTKELARAYIDSKGEHGAYYLEIREFDLNKAERELKEELARESSKGRKDGR